MPFEQIAIAGIYLPAFIADLALAGVLFLLLRILLTRLRVHRFVWHPALFEAALFTCILSAVVLILNP